MGSTSSKSARDTAFSAFTSALAIVAAGRYGLDSTEQWIAGVVFMAALTFGWRVLRKFAPWVTEDDATG